jgi:hypothetical protein
MSAQLTAGDEARINFPHGKCGDSTQVSVGCGSALDRTEEENGVCQSYPNCVLP